ncbi:hypothetical protein SMD44_p10093 (plasmid) [Streptomyces alboflavus]|uniref:Uncharacterized protein n=1 Tax=Streptomyces alboflavus TaxID=67267 RepID=A0A291W4W9_9ACTN|nr:hypothetical protein SMD44_p10093 [Streptomyces alboflavus]
MRAGFGDAGEERFPGLGAARVQAGEVEVEHQEAAVWSYGKGALGSNESRKVVPSAARVVAVDAEAAAAASERGREVERAQRIPRLTRH